VPSAAAAGAGADLADDTRDGTICFLAGVSSALVFAFAPVMWSQSTIVEVYSFGQFFMALVLILVYRWMRRPTDGLLFLTAFVFGLGLTNYQVLLLALVPLVFVILLQDIRLFRDFALVGIPMGLVAVAMKLGSFLSQPGFPKFPPIDPEAPVGSWLMLSGGPGKSFSPQDWYIAALVLGVVFLAVCGVLGRCAALRARGREPSWFAGAKTGLWVALVASGALLLVLCLALPAAKDPYAGHLAEMSRRYLAAGQPDPVFHWTKWALVFVAGLAALWVFALFAPGGLWYAGACTGIVVPIAAFLANGCLLGLTHPLSGWFAFYVACGAAILALAWLLLERGRTVALAILAGSAGLAFYGFMPIAGDVCPPLNWGYPRTWEGFKHAISRGQYEAIVPESVFTAKFIRQIATYFVDIRAQFTLVLAPLGLVPFAAWSLRRGKAPDGSARAPLRMLPFAVGAALLVAALTVLDRLSGSLVLSRLRVDKLLFLALLLLAAVGLLELFVDQVVPLVRRGFDESLDRSSRLVSFLSGAGILLVVAVAGCLFFNPVAEFALEDILGMHPGTGMYRFLDASLTGLLGAGWLALLVALALRVGFRDPAVDAGVDAVSGRWHIVTFVCFVMMSFLLIALANPRGDIQDNFIQKVKFIASHGLYALWIGYGMAYAMRFLRDDRRVRSVFLPACAAVALAPLIPVHENYRNFELYDKTSAADMDGHDFGWQFGNYQLRGAPAISEELRDDEEPLPNPCYPPEMTENAVFFGGTDPGRFVPTYMIYSAHVRPDVYLITQNALADKTYLDTMRGLYADAIWMPTEHDNQIAFREYDDRIQREIREGKRDPSDTGGLSHDAQGRVSVNGALAVMEINAIIAKQIFDRNRDLHDFYVEESYAMQWMYPYLSPHGLIMKVNHDTAPLSSANANADMDFWDWYVRRLLGDPGFAREIPARKSFNKLRSALAGSYSWRGDRRRAETAYRQAQSLYAYSPESSFRLVQDVLIPERRFETAADLLHHLKRLDPNNRNIPVEPVENLRDAQRRVDALRPKLDPGPDGQPAITEEELLSLVPDALACGANEVAQRALLAANMRRGTSRLFPVKLGLVLCDAGRPEQAARILATVPDLLADPSLSGSDVRTISTALIAANKNAAALSALRPYLRDRDPKDWRAWVQFALANHFLGDDAKALTGMEQARKFGGQEAIELMLKSPLATFLKPQNPPAAPRP
jgi:Flp pilus assembly protein TadD